MRETEEQTDTDKVNKQGIRNVEGDTKLVLETEYVNACPSARVVGGFSVNYVPVKSRAFWSSGSAIIYV